jgi:uncharacterized protein Smg (DUF494 family)
MSSTHILDLIVKIVHHVQHGKAISDFDMAEVNTDHRYNTSEISAAYSWVLQHGPELKRRKKGQVPRVLHIAERMVFSKEAWGWILELQSLGLIDHNGIERIIERIMMQYHGKVTLSMVKEIVVPFLLDNDRLSENSSTGLKGNESIN